MQEAQAPSLGQEDALEEEMAAHSSVLAWKRPWTGEPSGLQSMGSQRIGHDLAHMCACAHTDTDTDTHTHTAIIRAPPSWNNYLPKDPTSKHHQIGDWSCHM